MTITFVPFNLKFIQLSTQPDISKQRLHLCIVYSIDKTYAQHFFALVNSNEFHSSQYWYILSHNVLIYLLLFNLTWIVQFNAIPMSNNFNINYRYQITVINKSTAYLSLFLLLSFSLIAIFSITINYSREKLRIEEQSP